MFKLKAKTDSTVKELAAKILALKDKIGVLLDLELGIDFGGSERSMDIVLSTTFADRENLEIYRTHRDHIPVLNYAKEVCSETRVVDFEY